MGWAPLSLVTPITCWSPTTLEKAVHFIWPRIRILFSPCQIILAHCISLFCITWWERPSYLGKAAKWKTQLSLEIKQVYILEHFLVQKSFQPWPKLPGIFLAGCRHTSWAAARWCSHRKQNQDSVQARQGTLRCSGLRQRPGISLSFHLNFTTPPLWASDSVRLT